jgi:hypothetical protein
MESFRFIATTTLGSNATSITFDNIDNETYNDICFLVSARTDRSGVPVDAVRLRINDDSGTVYSQRGTYRQDGISQTAFNNGSPATYIHDSLFTNGGSTSSSAMGASIGWLYNIGNTDIIKVWSMEGYGQGYVVHNAGGWSNTEKVRKIVFTPTNATNFTAGSTFSMYGNIAPFPRTEQ